MTPIGDLHYQIDLSSEVTIHEKNLEGDVKNGIPTSIEQVNGMTHIGAH